MAITQKTITQFIQDLYNKTGKIGLTATSNTDTTTTTPAVTAATIGSILQTIWRKIRSVVNAMALKANINNPAFTGTPTAATAATGTNTTQIATTAFVINSIKSLVAPVHYVGMTYISPEVAHQEGTPNTVIIGLTGSYRITIQGAAGSASDSRNRPANAGYVGGKGAEISAVFTLQANDVLLVVVGKMGTRIDAATPPTDGISGMGGGGTFVFKKISANSGFQYHFNKDGSSYEVLLVAAGGGGTTDLNYSATPQHGTDGIGATWYSPTTMQNPNTTTWNGTTSTNQPIGGSIQHFIANNAIGGYYTRSNNQGRGGYGGGAMADDSRPAGGGWYCNSGQAYSWSLGTSTRGTTGKNLGNGNFKIEFLGTSFAIDF